MKFDKNTKTKIKVYENVIILMYAFCERNSVHYNVVEDAFYTYILNRKLKQALSDAEYYSNSNLKENDYFGNFLKASYNDNFEIYSREHSMKVVFKNANSLTDILSFSKVSISKIREFIQEVNFTLDFEDFELDKISIESLIKCNTVLILDVDAENK